METTHNKTAAPTHAPAHRTSNKLENRKHGRRMSHERRPSSVPREVKNDNVVIPPIGDAIRIIPLGGVEEIGKNMTAIQFKDDIIVVDVGIQFSTEDTPGIDYILPNTKYLEDNKDKIRAVVITHGHLDHIGGLPYIMDRIGNPPIYTREFAALLIKKRFTEFPNLPELNLKIVEKDDGSLPIGKHLKVKFFGLTHSIPDSTGVIIETPYGDIVNTGDVRVDNTDGVPNEREVEQYKIFKNRKILLLAMDSTGIDKPGWAMSETHILTNIDKIVAQVPGRIIIATFASQVERIIEFLNIAKKYGKKVVIEGRSMKVNVEIIKHLKLADTKHIVPLEEVEKHPPHKIMMLATGAQGEEFAALMRMSNKSHKFIRLNKTDTIILSSSVIPGNERSVTMLKDNLFRHDCRIITYLDSDVHTSGHGKRGELEWIHKQIPYKFFMPVHGHHFMLKMHAELAIGLGAKRENVIVPDNGSVIEIFDEGRQVRVLKEKAPSSAMMVDGFSVGNIQEVVIRDRQMLAQDGMFVIIATVNSTNGKLRKSPDIISRGFVYLRESQDLLRQARFIIKKTIEDSTAGMNPINFDYVKTNVTDELSKFLFQETAKRPIVIPVILGI
jgi:ribonuclease J